MSIWDKRHLDQGLEDVGTNGPYVELFRNQVAAECNVEPENVFLSNSGTSALELSLQQINPGPRTIVIMPAMNFIGSVNVVKKAGFSIYLVDVNPDTLLMDFDDKLNAICKSLKHVNDNVIIMPTLLYGAAYDYMLDKYVDFNYIDGIIFDACEAFGAKLLHENCGLMNKKVFSCYSFNNNKILTTGGGGAIVASMRHISDISDRNRQGSYGGVGENKGMPSLNAQLGWKTITNGTFSCNMEQKKAIYFHYKLSLNGICEFVKFQKQGNGNYWYTFIMFSNYMSKESTINEFDKLGIPYRLPFQAFNLSRNALRANHLGLCLPSSPEMLKFFHLFQVVDIIKKAVKKYG